MLQAIRWMAVLILPVVVFTLPVDGAQKGKGGKETENSEKMIKAGVLVGKVAAIYEDKRKIRLSVAVPKVELNQGAIQQMAQAQQQMAQSQAQGNWQGMQQARMTMLQAQASLYTQRVETKDIELEATDEVVVRTLRPREEFDDKGKIKKLSRKELAELKGPDKKLPGYKAEFGDVATDQIIQVQLVRKKPAPGSSAPKPRVLKTKGKGKGEADADAAMDLLADNMPQISMIIIVQDPPPAR